MKLYTVVFDLDAKSVKTSALLSLSVEWLIRYKPKFLIGFDFMMCIIAYILAIFKAFLLS